MKAVITGIGACEVRIDSHQAYAALSSWLAANLPADDVQIISAVPLSGGAIQENWQIELAITGGPKAGRHKWVLRTDAPSQVSVSQPRSVEFALISYVHSRGVLVPEPICLCDGDDVIGRRFFFMQAMQGTAQGHKLTRLDSLPQFSEALARQLGQQMACLHHIGPDTSALHMLAPPAGHPGRYQIDMMRVYLDEINATAPVIEYGLNWLEDKLADWPVAMPQTLCHRDFRTGNFLIDKGQMTALLDWEFAGWSDRHEDIGWLCARCWRFANPHLAVGGLADFAPFQAAYEAESGIRIDQKSLSYWQVMAEIRWAVIALQQAARNDQAEELSLELSLSGQMVPEMEYHMLNLITDIDTGQWKAAL